MEKIVHRFCLLNTPDVNETIAAIKCADREHINTPDATGMTPLGRACCSNNARVVAALLQNGAQVVRDQNGCFPVEHCFTYPKHMAGAERVNFSKAIHTENTEVPDELLATLNVLAQANGGWRNNMQDTIGILPLERCMKEFRCQCQDKCCTCMQNDQIKQLMTEHNTHGAGKPDATRQFIYMFA